jgi:hypothetical protein
MEVSVKKINSYEQFYVLHLEYSVHCKNVGGGYHKSMYGSET